MVKCLLVEYQKKMFVASQAYRNLLNFTFSHDWEKIISLLWLNFNVEDITIDTFISSAELDLHIFAINVKRKEFFFPLS